jgi:hypothetical protein
MTVDRDRFDTLTRALGTGTSRRGALRAAGAAAGLLGLGGLLAAGEAEARKGGKKRRRRRCKPTPGGEECQSSKDCCPGKTRRVCAEPFNSPGDPKVCCRPEGEMCEFPSDCCNGFTCPPGGGKCEEEA